ncbi:MAG: Alcohol dehydrogenase zinc-binding domain protein [Gammaproteobacteria bacterium]|nr:Alcohol dehydrogenase zinc-binding domain protein [Gammaproteobacteria bacterium]
MTRRYRALVVVLTLVALVLVSLALALSHNSPCGAPVSLHGDVPRMKAIVSRCYGSPEVLTLEELVKPVAADNEVLVKVHAAAVNPLDWHYMRGTPYIMRLSVGLGTPKDTRVGVDFAGTVEAVGRNVTRFKPGDEVFGGKNGALAEYVTVREDRALARKPPNLTFEQAASVPVAAVTALQALRDKGRIQPGQKVLINGASGGVGTFAVQIAKSFGADVTGVCSTRNVELVRSIGADHVIDYTREDFTQNGQRYDLILDNVGNHSFSEYRRVMKPKGTFVIVGGPTGDPWIGPLVQPIKAGMLSPFVSQEFVMFLAELNRKDLEFLSGLLQAGKVTPVIDRRYSLSEVPAAIRYLEEGRARGKVVISFE